MTSQATDKKQAQNISKKSCSQKRVSSSWNQNYDSENEMAVTSTSGRQAGVNTSQHWRQNKRPKPSDIQETSKKHMVSNLNTEIVYPSYTGKDDGMNNIMVTDDPLDLRKKSNLDSGCQRLLMREWLMKEISYNRIPGLKWLDENKKLICIPWIHGSKEEWSQHDHCKLFENWAIYTGKYDPLKDNPDPKRWKANFRCALNSLPDVCAVPELSRKNGTNGYKVYQFNDPVVRKHRKNKSANTNVSSKFKEKSNPTKVSFESIPSTEFGYEEQFGDHLLSTESRGAGINCTAEIIHDTVPIEDPCFLSIPSVVPDGLVLVVVGNVLEEENQAERPPANCENKEVKQDTLLFRNMDHNYFRNSEIQIPTTVEDYHGDDSPSETEQQQRKWTKNFKT